MAGPISTLDLRLLGSCILASLGHSLLERRQKRGKDAGGPDDGCREAAECDLLSEIKVLCAYWVAWGEWSWELIK